MKQISLTVPMDYNALTRASDMLHGLAIDLEKQGANWEDDPVKKQQVTEEVAEFITDVEETSDGPLMAMAKACGAVEEDYEPSPSLFAETPAEAPKLDNVTAVVGQSTETTPAPSAPAGVELDGEGLPWDARIHGGGKTKLAKAPHGWKKKRGVSPELVAEVEAELRAAMAAPTPNAPAEPAPVVDSATTIPTTAEPAQSVPVGPNATPTPPPPATAAVAPTPPPPATTPTPAAAPATAPAAAQPASGITTLPELMAASTAAGKTPADMLAAAQKAGLASVALLGARPDLVPTVAAELGLGG